MYLQYEPSPQNIISEKTINFSFSSKFGVEKEKTMIKVVSESPKNSRQKNKKKIILIFLFRKQWKNDASRNLSYEKVS